MAGYGGPVAVSRIDDDGMATTFASKLAAVLLQMFQQLLPLHVPAPDWTRILSRIDSTTSASGSLLVGFGRGSGLPSSTRYSANSRRASRSILRADASVCPWLIAPGKSSTSAVYQPLSASRV